jgi:hypothetical protein
MAAVAQHKSLLLTAVRAAPAPGAGPLLAQCIQRFGKVWKATKLQVFGCTNPGMEVIHEPLLAQGPAITAPGLELPGHGGPAALLVHRCLKPSTTRKPLLGPHVHAASGMGQ